MKTLSDKLNLLHFSDSTFKEAARNQCGLCALCCLNNRQTFAPVRLVIQTRTLRGKWPDRYLCSVCASAIAEVHLGVKSALAGKALIDLFLVADISEEEKAIIRFLRPIPGSSFTVGQLKIAIGSPLSDLPVPQVRAICANLCDREILKQTRCGNYDRYSLAEELAHAS